MSEEEMAAGRFARWGRFVDRWKRAILLGSAVVASLAALSLRALEFEMDMVEQLPAGQPVFDDAKSFLRSFAMESELILLVEGPAIEVSAFSGALARALSRDPGVARVSSSRDREDLGEWIRERRLPLLTLGDLERLADRVTPGAIERRVAGLRQALTTPFSVGAPSQIASDPLGFDEILADSLRRRYGGADFHTGNPQSGLEIVRVTPKGSAFDTAFGTRLLSRARTIERGLLEGEFAGHGLTVGHTGGIAYAVEDRSRLEADLRTYLSIAPLFVLGIFYVGFRSLRVILVVGVVVAVVALVTFGVSVAVFDRLTMISIAFSAVFFGLGVDSAIHFFSALRRREGVDSAAVGAALREIGLPNLWATLTSIVVFSTIGLSSFTGVRQLGILTAVAIFVNLAATFVLLPALVLQFRVRASPVLSSGFGGGIAGLASRLAGQPIISLVATGAILIAALVAIPRLGLETDLRSLRPSGGEAAEMTRRLEAARPWIADEIALLTKGETLGEALERVDSLVHRLEGFRQQGRIASYSSLSTFFPSAEERARRAFRVRLLPREEIADTLERALDAQGFDLAAFARPIGSWRAGAEDASVPGSLPQELQPLESRHVRSADGGAVLATYFSPGPEGDAGAIVEELRRLDVGGAIEASGGHLLIDAFRSLLRHELVLFFAVALTMNFTLLAFFHAGLGRAVVLLAPALVAVPAYLGGLALGGFAIDPVNVIVVPLMIGLGVDHSLYVEASVRETKSVAEGFRRSAAPVALVTATTVAGFGTLALSGYPALRHLGGFAAFALILAAGTTLLVLPALVARIGRGNG